jgi:excisionase family DNA binding protein
MNIDAYRHAKLHDSGPDNTSEIVLNTLQLSRGVSYHKAQLDQVSSDRSVSIKDKKLLSVEEAAELFGIGRGKIRQITDDEKCPFVIWIGGHRKIKHEAFEEYIMRQYSI